MKPLNVVINGVEYSPRQKTESRDVHMRALNLSFECCYGNFTVREYLLKLLLTVWDERDEFSGKAPFGNSGWEWDLYTPLAENGYIACTRNSDGEIVSVDEKTAHAFVCDLIIAAFKGV